MVKNARCLIEKTMIILAVILLLGSICSFHKGQATEIDKLLGKNVRMIYSIEPGTPFKLVITDDPADEVDSKGEVKFITSDNIELELPFFLEKGKSADYEVSSSENVKRVIIELKEGSIFIDSGDKLRIESSPSEPQVSPKMILLPQGSFSADMFINMEGKITTGKFYLSDHLYRFDTTGDGQAQSMIVDRKTGKVWLLNINEKAYAISSTEDFGVHFLNPFEAHFWMTAKYKITDRGKEKVGELLCEKKELMEGELLVQTAWISEKYRFPLKLINYDKNKQHMLLELRNIKEEKINPEIFEVPSDFRLIK